MKVEWNKSSVLLSGISVLFCLLSVWACVQFILAPLTEQIENYEQSIESEKKIVLAMESKAVDSEREDILTSRNIQQQLPVIPLLDQMLIGFERAESHSTSLMNAMGIADTESMLVYKDFEETEPEKEMDSESVEKTEQTPAEEPGPMIEGLHTLQFSLDMTSENFAEMIQFLAEIQSLPRITQIESIQFDAPSSEDELNYSLLLNSYYLPLYSELANEAPQYNYGGTSDKVNPFTKEQMGVETPQSEGEQIEETQEDRDESTSQM